MNEPTGNVVHFRELVDREKALTKEIMGGVRELLQAQHVELTKALDVGLRNFNHEIEKALTAMRDEDHKRLRDIELENARIAERQKILEERLAKNERGDSEDDADRESIKAILKRALKDKNNPNGRWLAGSIFFFGIVLLLMNPSIRHAIPFLPF